VDLPELNDISGYHVDPGDGIDEIFRNVVELQQANAAFQL
jgi:hypothetical protein